jgi:hypothetical protein
VPDAASMEVTADGLIRAITVHALENRTDLGRSGVAGSR